MCINYDIHKPKTDPDYWSAEIDEDLLDYPGNFAVRPADEAPVVWHDPERNQRRMSLFEFSMIPSWTKTEKDAAKNRYKFFNARDDRLLESNLWKPRFKSKRCLIPANGFFEPHKYPKKVEVPGGPKKTNSIPFYFRLKSTDHFAFAGLYDEWTHPGTGEIINTYSIITTDPNRQMKKIHNKNPRQPVILNKEDYDFWLDRSVNPKDYFGENIFSPWPDEDMQHWQVTKQLDYNGSGNELIEPVANPVKLEADGKQSNLFS